MADYSNLRAKANEIKNETVQGRNTASRVGTLFNDIIDALGGIEGGQSSLLNLPLSSINGINANPSAVKSFLFYGANSSWGYRKLEDVAGDIHQYLTTNNYYNTMLGDKVVVNPSLTTGTEIGTITVGSTTKTLYAPTSGGISEPAAYLKSASVSDNTLTLTNKDNTVVTFTPSGGSDGGSTVSISDLLSTGTTIANITIDGTPYSIKAPAGGSGDTVSIPYAYPQGENTIKIASIKINNAPNVDIYAPLSSGEGGTQYVENPYDDSWINGAITSAVNQLDSSLSSSIAALQSDLNAIQNWKRTDIVGVINDVLDGKNFIDGWQAGWDENLKAYLISVGVLGANGVDKGWAYLEVLYNSLNGRVAAIEQSIGDGGEINLELLEANLKLYIDQELEAAIAQLEANYALTDQDKTVLKWLSAGLYAEASANKALAQVFATAEQYTALSDTVTQINSATSGLTTRVEQLENGDWVASSSLGSLVQKEIVDTNTGLIKAWLSQAGVVTQNSLDSALAGLSATLSTTYATKSELGTYATTAALAGLTATVDDINGKYVAKTSLGSEIKNMITDSEGHLIWEEIVSAAGLATTTDIDTATAALFAQNGAGTAAINLAVTNGISNATISADQIQLNANFIEAIGSEIYASFDSDKYISISEGNITVFGGYNSTAVFTEITHNSITIKDTHDTVINGSGWVHYAYGTPGADMSFISGNGELSGYLLARNGLAVGYSSNNALLGFYKGNGNTIVVSGGTLSVSSLDYNGTSIDLSSYSELLDNFNNMCSNWTFNSNGTVSMINAYKMELQSDLTVDGDIDCDGRYRINNDPGISGSFTTNNGKTVVVNGGIITEIS